MTAYIQPCNSVAIRCENDLVGCYFNYDIHDVHLFGFSDSAQGLSASPCTESLEFIYLAEFFPVKLGEVFVSVVFGKF